MDEKSVARSRYKNGYQSNIKVSTFNKLRFVEVVKKGNENKIKLLMLHSSITPREERKIWGGPKFNACFKCLFLLPSSPAGNTSSINQENKFISLCRDSFLYSVHSGTRPENGLCWIRCWVNIIQQYQHESFSMNDLVDKISVRLLFA